MEAEGEAITFVSPEEEGDVRGIERTLGKTIPRVTLPDFDYQAPPPPRTRAHEGAVRSHVPRRGYPNRGRGRFDRRR